MSTSLSRAFTTKRNKSIDASPAIPKRSLTTKHSATIRYEKISAPIELISTTNMLSYNAPDIYPRSRSSTTSSAASMTTGSSASDSGSPSSLTTPLTSPETSSIESSPTSKSPEANHLSCYFGVPTSDDEAPKIPQRAPSHTKRSAERVARKRSMSKMTSPKNSISRTSNQSQSHQPSKHSFSNSVSTSRSSINMFSQNPETLEHPFGNELAQVSELVEEYGQSKEKLTIFDQEEQELISMGLYKFGVDDYLNELQELYSLAFNDPPPMPQQVWI
jgi:hypothetical protein